MTVALDHTFTVGDGQWVVHNCAAVNEFKGWIKHDVYNQIRKQFGKDGVQKYIDAMKKGFVPGEGQQGVKLYDDAFHKKYGYRVAIKVKGHPVGDFRAYGNYDPETGFHVFTKFGRHLCGK